MDVLFYLIAIAFYVTIHNLHKLLVSVHNNLNLIRVVRLERQHVISQHPKES